jgi:hypothetical protein
VLVNGNPFDTCRANFPAANMYKITCQQVMPQGAIVAMSTTPSTSNFMSGMWTAGANNVGGANPTRNEVVTIPEPGSLSLLVYATLGVGWRVLKRRT